jgi:hypothetical protein
MLGDGDKQKSTFFFVTRDRVILLSLLECSSSDYLKTTMPTTLLHVERRYG